MSQTGHIDSGKGVPSSVLPSETSLPSQDTTHPQPEGEDFSLREPPRGTGTAESRMRAMRIAIQRSGGILLLDTFCVDSACLSSKGTSSPAETKARKAVLQGLEKVKEAFDKLDALDPETLKKVTLDTKTSRIVENAFEQLNALDERLAELEAIAGPSVGTRNLRDASMARLCELSRFVGALQAEAMTEAQRLEHGIQGFEPLKPGAGSVREMLGELAITMHGNDPASREVSAEAEKLFADIQTLKSDLKGLTPHDAARAIENLRQHALALKQRWMIFWPRPPADKAKACPVDALRARSGAIPDECRKFLKP